MNVADYYDRNTRRFLRFGRLGSLGVVHRGVWAPGVEDATAAAHYVHDLIAADVARRFSDTPWGLDLGCGVGASMIRIADRTGARISGITISSTQAEIAKRRLSELRPELGGRLAVFAGDFCAPETYEDIPENGIDFAYFIESFVHAPDPDALLGLLTTRLKPGARVYICDDFLGSPLDTARDTARDTASSSHAGGQSDEEILENYRRGWRIHNLATPQELATSLATFGLIGIERLDLTPYLKLNRLGDLIIRVAVPLFRPFAKNTPWWDNLLGGDALQRALTAGLIQYRLKTFEYRP